MFDRVVWRLVYCKLLRTQYTVPAGLLVSSRGLPALGVEPPCLQRTASRRQRVREKSEEIHLVFSPSMKYMDGPPTSSDDSAVPFHHLPEIVRNGILDSSTGDERSRSVQRELIEGRAARHDAQVHANTALTAKE